MPCTQFSASFDVAVYGAGAVNVVYILTYNLQSSKFMKRCYDFVTKHSIAPLF